MQPEAIAKLIEGSNDGHAQQTILSVTRSGKNHTITNVINEVQHQKIILAPNKTLTARLYEEVREFSSWNAVGQ